MNESSNHEDDITHLIERMEAFEERLGVRLEALFAIKGWGDELEAVSITGELHPKEGFHLEHDLKIVLDIVDSAGRVVVIEEHCVCKNEFYGFESFQISAYVAHTRISKLRLYPKKW